MERDKADISLPATFTCSMTHDEAGNRIFAARRHPGVTFTLEGRTADKKLIGCTIVTNLSSFDKFNKDVFPKSI